MTRLPKLAIVGRPNVGKSALFNKIAKKKIAIVDEAEGVTRDRLYTETDLFGFPFELIDTGGIDPRSKSPFNEEVKRQAEIAIEEADALILVVDSKVGILDLDQEVAELLLKQEKPVCLAVNKVDQIEDESKIYPFYSLGIKDIIAVSAAHNWKIAELLEMALKKITSKNSTTENHTVQKIAIIGRPNVGKSSLVNYLLNQERCIVSPVAGTTRDSIDTPLVYKNTHYTLIDTAGIKRKPKEKDVVEKFAAIRTERAIERADICILMLDAQQGLTVQEKRIAQDIEDKGKGCVLLFNKWDLVKGFRMEHCLRQLQEDIPFLRHCPKLFISAKTGRNIPSIFEAVATVAKESGKRISTHQLNKVVEDAIQKNHPPLLMGKRLRIYYTTQIAVHPPTFLCFVNSPHLMMGSYKRYLHNQIRQAYQFSGVPLVIHIKGKQKNKKAIDL